MKYLFSFFILITTVFHAQALLINEILSNPVGDDGGREWIEIYNNTDTGIDVSTLTVSIKNGSFIPVIPVSGGVTIGAHSYGIIASTVSGVTRFMQDYPQYNGPLLKSAISLVNTGVTSIEFKLQGVTSDALSSYTAAKEGSSYALLQGAFSIGIPSPGEENKAPLVEEDVPTTTTTAGTQTTLAQTSPPSADIILYLPKEKIVVAGAPALFSVFSSTHAGKMIDNMTYTWGFGEGGYGTGSSTLYRYLYPGRYIAQVDGTNGLIAGTGRMIVRVVSPEVSISSISVGKYGSYIDITNPNEYDIDLSYWKITIDGVPFTFPKNTLLTQGVTRFPGSSLGFASTTVSSSTVIRLLFQNMDEVLRVVQGEFSAGSSTLLKTDKNLSPTQGSLLSIKSQKKVTKSTKVIPINQELKTSSSTSVGVSTTKNFKKDTRVATFIRSLFGN